MFERLTENARAALLVAQDTAIATGATAIDVGHVLCGCAEGSEETAGTVLRAQGVTGELVRSLLPTSLDPAQAGTVDPDALRAIGIDYDGVRAAVDETFGPGALEAAPNRRLPHAGVRRPPFTPEAKRVLELSLRITLELHQTRITPGHIVLAMLRLDDALVADVLRCAGTTVAGLSGAVLSQLAAAA